MKNTKSDAEYLPFTPLLACPFCCSGNVTINLVACWAEGQCDTCGATSGLCEDEAAAAQRWNSRAVAPHYYLAFRVGEWFARALRHLDSEALDSRELGRHLLTLTCESMSIDVCYEGTINRAREAAVNVCVSYSGAGGGGVEMVNCVRQALVEAIARCH